MVKPIRVVIVDDHAFVRDGLCAYLSSRNDFAVVGSAASGEEALEVIKNNFADMVIMELEFSGMNGIETINRIKLFSPESKVVVLTYCDDDRLIRSAFQAGATTLFFKDMKMDQLVEAIRKSENGEPPIHPRFAFLILERFCSTSNRHTAYGVEFTANEINLLNLISKGYAKSKIANLLSFNEKKISLIENGILSKLQDNNP